MMKFESAGQKYRYINDRYNMDKVCLNCNQTFGQHSGLTCHNREETTFLLAEELPNDSGDPNLEFLKKQSEKYK